MSLTGSLNPTVLRPSSDPLPDLMVSSLVYIMFGFSGSVPVTWIGDLAFRFWEFLHFQYKQPHITTSNKKPEPDPPPTM